MNARRAIAALDDVLWAVGLENVTKVARSPLTRAGFDQMVSALVSALQQQTEPQRHAALTSALRQLDHRWGNVSTEDRSRLIASAMAQYVSGAGSLVAGTKNVLGQHMNTVAARSRAANIRSHQLKLPLEDPFGLVDPQVLEHARNSTALFIRDSRGVIAGRLSAVARGVVSDGLAQGWDDQTIAGELATALRGTEAQQSRTYLTTVSSVFVARARNYGTLRSFTQAGITTYEHVAVLDEMTCGVCRFMHGRTFDVRVSLDQYAAVAAGGPESVIALQPFMRTAKLPSGERVIAVPSGGALVPVADVDDDGVGRVDSPGSFRPRIGDKAIQRMGCGCPVHPRCRCTIVPGSTSLSAQVPASPSAPAVAPGLSPPPQVSPTPQRQRPAKPAAAPTTPPAQPPSQTPASPQFTEGVHAKRITGNASKADKAAVLRGFADLAPGLLEFLEHAPLAELSLKRTVGRHQNGWWRAVRGVGSEIAVRLQRAPGSTGQGLKPGVSWSVSQSGADDLSAATLTLIHELGHHLHLHDFLGMPAEFVQVNAVIRDAKRRTSGAVTKYGSKNGDEYFAECFALYVIEPQLLKAHDGVGFAMVEQVLAIRQVTVR